MCSATAEIITRIKDAAFEIGPSHVQNAWSVKLPSVISTIQMCHLNWNITWAVALEVTNINFLIAHFATIYENISLHVSLTFGTVCQTVLWMSVL